MNLRRLSKPSALCLSLLVVFSMLFLFSATALPVKAASPGSFDFGNTSIGTITNYFRTDKDASRFELAQGGLLQSITVYFQTFGFNAKAAIYADDFGEPFTLIAQSSSQVVTASGWKTFSIPQSSLNAGFYWLCVISDSSASLGAMASTSSNAHSWKFGSYLGEFSSTFGTPGGYEKTVTSIYATCLATSSTPAPTLSPAFSPSPTPYSLPGSQIPAVAVSASSYNGVAYAPLNAIDGIESTSNYWGTSAASGLPQWLKIDLGFAASINQVVTHFYDGNTRTYTYYVEASFDGSSWSTVVFTKEGSGLVTDLFTQVNARYVRITVVGNSANTAAHIEEIKIYQSTGTPSPLPTPAVTPSPTAPTSNPSPLPNSQIPAVAVSASSYNGVAYAPLNAIDGIESTSNYWGTSAASGLPQWLKIDLGFAASINQVVTHFYDGNTRTYTYYVEASFDGSLWSTVVFTKEGSGLVTDLFTQVNARYVRITVVGNSANTAAHIEEIKIYQSTGTPSPLPTPAVTPSPTAPTSNPSPLPNSQIPAVAVSASSYNGVAYAPLNAIDGIESTSNYWGTSAASGLPQWLKIDLGFAASINQVVTHFYDGNTRTYTYYVEASFDGSLWSTVVFTKEGSGLVTDLFTQVNARYVRITVVGNSANTAAHIEEIKVYSGTPSSSPLPTPTPTSAPTPTGMLSYDMEIADNAPVYEVSIGDVDGDGFNDIIGAVEHVGLSYYRYPNWDKHTIYLFNHMCDDIDSGDIDNDGSLDVIGVENNINIYWFDNSNSAASWTRYFIGSTGSTSTSTSIVRNVKIVDFNRDGKLDVIIRTPTTTCIYLQVTPTSWNLIKTISHSFVNYLTETINIDGLDVGDIDRDGDLDIVLNGFWVETPSDLIKDYWVQHSIDSKWYNQNSGGWEDNNAKVCVVDINRDGNLDVLFSQNERAGFSVSWYETSGAQNGVWVEHVIGYVDFCHTLRVGDLNNDGYLDVVAGEMERHEGFNVGPFSLYVFFNDGSQNFVRREISSVGIYSGVIGDIGNDGLLDIVGSRSYWKGPLQIWRGYFQ